MSKASGATKRNASPENVASGTKRLYPEASPVKEPPAKGQGSAKKSVNKLQEKQAKEASKVLNPPPAS